jgi:hypothetical protein
MFSTSCHGQQPFAKDSKRALSLSESKDSKELSIRLIRVRVFLTLISLSLGGQWS